MGQPGVRTPHGSRARLAGACSREARPAHACEPSGGGNRRRGGNRGGGCRHQGGSMEESRLNYKEQQQEEGEGEDDGERRSNSKWTTEGKGRRKSKRME
ncbi:hypothetical protein PVAP13_2NG266403 [Panicum virgatum]|uniref:Uncharacterized protein n=1 Tax=Panicum virgatum TaxID=38727 RepID=A0A8T0VNS8_PANVG|nr:hypothetical protein PVAP13_2NG266403 [Panicum virgatum]